MAFDPDKLKADLAALAAKGLFLGTSSWKYPGWFGQLYERDRYIWRGKFSNARFERHCLAEYSQVFKTVSVDAAYYQFPTVRWLEAMVSQVPDDFQFTLKVTDEITLKRFPNLPRFGQRAGKPNEHFLNADLFASAFLVACEPFRANIGVLMFEFSQFYSGDFARGREFVAALDEFLVKLPRGWRYGVELRNRNFLQPEYFTVLTRHGAAHVFNSWQDMPPVDEQLALPGCWSNPEFLAARFLLRPGRRYEDAVKLFSPYEQVKDPYLEGRKAAAKLIKSATTGSNPAKAFIYVNNRLEGNALESIAAVMDEAGAK
ncbi:MAG: DUF72 domain-containing protein [Verrucomicrobia bacterium]|nr:DUF72 domain-containing protein [Verrucomicrobiota bacterium]